MDSVGLRLERRPRQHSTKYSGKSRAHSRAAVVTLLQSRDTPTIANLWTKRRFEHEELRAHGRGLDVEVETRGDAHAMGPSCDEPPGHPDGANGTEAAYSKAPGQACAEPLADTAPHEGRAVPCESLSSRRINCAKGTGL